MIRSSLIKPLVAPLVARRTGGRRSASGLSKSRIAATAIAMTALLAATAPDEAAAAQAEAPVARTAHQKPTRLVAAPQLADMFVATVRRLTGELLAPCESAGFDHEALDLTRYRHRTDRARDGGILGSGRRLDRLIGPSSLAFKTFGSARILAAQPHS